MTTPQANNLATQQAEISQILTGLEQRFHTVSGGAAVAAVAQAAVYHLPGARGAAVTLIRADQVRTLVATAPLAQKIEALQHELDSGPSVDPALDGNVHLSRDLARDRRWPTFGPQAHDRFGLTSLLTHRIPLIGDPERTVGFTLYSDTTDAFAGQALWAGGLLAAHCAQAVAAQLHLQHTQNLERALESNREIGAAVGVLMARHGITGEQALELLREASQSTHQELATIAADVVHTGQLPFPHIFSDARHRPRRAPEATGCPLCQP